MVKGKVLSPFKRLLVPIFPESNTQAAIGMARSLSGPVRLLGLLPVEPWTSISAETGRARILRKQMGTLGSDLPLSKAIQVRVTPNPFEELLAVIRDNPPDLLILEWPTHFEALKCNPADLLDRLTCDVAVVRGPWPETVNRILVPLRGGRYAETALRLGMGMPHKEIHVLNFSASSSPEFIESSFRGLARILPNLSGVVYRRVISDDPAGGILAEAEKADLLFMGASMRSIAAERTIGSIVEKALRKAPCAVVVVKSALTEEWRGEEGERAGLQAISILVDRWFAENTYHAEEFENLERLVELKREQGLTISLALPALNEEKTVGKVLSTVKKTLMEDFSLLDEIVLMDSNSTDKTREIATDLGIPVYIHQELLPDYGAREGKGEALWKSLFVTSGDILAWIDTDIKNIHPRFVYGVIGPLLVNPSLKFVKGFYRRPLKVGKKRQAGGGGRVTELTARPMINLFYPELSGVIQPLSGEYGGRREALEKTPFYSGYGVEVGLLIEILEKYGLSAIAQVDLVERIHHNQTLEALSKMSFVILQAFFHKLEKHYKTPILEEVNKTMKLVHYKRGNYFLDIEEVVERERPPMEEIPEYHDAQVTKLRGKLE